MTRMWLYLHNYHQEWWTFQITALPKLSLSSPDYHHCTFSVYANTPINISSIILSAVTFIYSVMLHHVFSCICTFGCYFKDWGKKSYAVWLYMQSSLYLHYQDLLSIVYSFLEVKYIIQTKRIAHGSTFFK